MATKAELRNRAGEMLGLLPPGQALQSQHTTRIEEAYAEVYADLKTEGLNIWASDGDCPDELNPYIAGLMALNCTETYPVSTARFQRIVAKVGIDGDRGKREIRRLVTPEHESVEEATDY